MPVITDALSIGNSSKRKLIFIGTSFISLKLTWEIAVNKFLNEAKLPQSYLIFYRRKL